MRIGHGYDAHRLVENRKLILGGVTIPHDKGLLGHSDADVLVHAICDALVGAAGLGDMGTHFPDTDNAYKDISSLKLLADVGKMLRSKGYRISNIDATVIAQEPKLIPFIPTMVKQLAEALEIQISQVNVKATTTEGMGFTGTGQGIAALSTVLIVNGDAS